MHSHTKSEVQNIETKHEIQHEKYTIRKLFGLIQSVDVDLPSSQTQMKKDTFQYKISNTKVQKN